MLNVHSENHGSVLTTSNSFFQVRRHTSVVLEELEGCDTSELSLDVKEEVEDVDSKNSRIVQKKLMVRLKLK